MEAQSPYVFNTTKPDLKNLVFSNNNLTVEKTEHDCNYYGIHCDRLSPSSLDSLRFSFKIDKTADFNIFAGFLVKNKQYQSHFDNPGLWYSFTYYNYHESPYTFMADVGNGQYHPIGAPNAEGVRTYPTRPDDLRIMDVHSWEEEQSIGKYYGPNEGSVFTLILNLKGKVTLDWEIDGQKLIVRKSVREEIEKNLSTLSKEDIENLVPCVDLYQRDKITITK